jgi:hypothetical protein
LSKTVRENRVDIVAIERAQKAGHKKRIVGMPQRQAAKRLGRTRAVPFPERVSRLQLDR